MERFCAAIIAYGADCSFETAARGECAQHSIQGHANEAHAEAVGVGTEI
jgi:hypothetical protein